MRKRKYLVCLAIGGLLFSNLSSSYALDNLTKEEKRKQELNALQKQFEWWPTDAKPGPVKDPERGGYWWWPTESGQKRPWGNRGYVYVYKIIFDYKEEELPPPKPKELRPSLLIKKIIRNVKLYFDYDSAVLRDDARKILSGAVGTLKRNPETSILVTGNCDRRGSEAYNDRLGRHRGDSVKKFMLENGINEERIRIISRGKLDAVAPLTDLVGMQKDRNAQFVIAEVEEVMLLYPGEPGIEIPEAKKIEEGKFLVEEEKKIESTIKVETREYIIQKGDTLSKIAQEQLGKAHRWKYLYELNKDAIKDPNKLKPGKKIIIPVE
ncbi:MAG: OmpA family protein [Candidatus Omnitrophota bacterium]|nr:OmpA family protein [Candidatus Omnitrophota bacterium]